MESFEIYYEKFSLNPLNWRREYKEAIFQKQIRERVDARKNTHKYLRELNAILKQRGYSIHKHEFAYTIRCDRKVGLDNPKNKKGQYIVGPNSKIPYVRVLFTKAHEVGHVLQFDETKNETYTLDTKVARILNAKTLKEADMLRHIHEFWDELDAWARGLAFIPPEFKREYKKYAKKCYSSYQDHSISFYTKQSKEIAVLLHILDPANTQY